MDRMTVEDLMVPLDEYATVDEDATLYEAVKALEKAQEEQDRKGYHYLHRAVLVLDKKRNVVGKISQLDVIRALEPKYLEFGDMRNLSRTGFSPDFIKSMIEKYSLCQIPFTDMCIRAGGLKVRDFMYSPGEGEYIEADALLCEAIHAFVMGYHQSLLVTRDKRIIGILRLTDLFKEVFQRMETNKAKQAGA
jgi:CBS domain-containing protein